MICERRNKRYSSW